MQHMDLQKKNNTHLNPKSHGTPKIPFVFYTVGINENYKTQKNKD